MSQYALVISDDPETILKSHADEFRSFKKADWLYDGLVYQEGVTCEMIKEKVFSQTEFLPTVVIDGHSFLSSAKFSDNAWQSNLKKFIDLSNPSHMSFWVLEAK